MKELVQQIREWSILQPQWQQEALCRLWKSTKLTSNDLEELLELCKQKYGLSNTDLTPNPFEPEDEDLVIESFILESITHCENVNALAPGQKITFGSNLTVIYGQNGAGKSGYARILKSACRARGKEEIIGNVLQTSPGIPSASISLSLLGESKVVEWHDDQPETFLNNISVFDANCASVYLEKKTDVAYRPFGLDLFDRLSELCQIIKSLLEKERTKINCPIKLPNLSYNTKAYNAVKNLTALTKKEDLSLLQLSIEEKNRLQELRQNLQILDDKNSPKLVRELELKIQRFKDLSCNISNIIRFDMTSQLNKLNEYAKERESCQLMSNKLKQEVLDTRLLAGTGNDSWITMWETAKKFSFDYAYPKQEFPVTGKDKNCVLCQQALSASAVDRFDTFSKFLQSELTIKITELSRKENLIKDEIESISLINIESTLAEIEIEEPRLKDFIIESNDAWNKIKLKIKNIQSSDDMPEFEESFEQIPNEITKLCDILLTRVDELNKGLDPKHKDSLEIEVKELEARRLLSENLPLFFEEIERLRSLSAFSEAISDTTTNSITLKSKELTREVVTKSLIDSFSEEIKLLKFRHVEVVLKEAGGDRGTLYHKLEFKRAPGVNVHSVVSDGEARCLAIASFLAELSTCSYSSPIIFDDPVCSLDHNWREGIAKRLAMEAENRQVVIFTHDIVFLMALKRHADENNVSTHFQHVKRENMAGMTTDDMPWGALTTKKRIGKIKNDLQGAGKMFRENNLESYNEKVISIYGKLRETWERAVEEILLNNVVERYGSDVKTKRAAILADIEETDLRELESGMSKSSRWLSGHDHAIAEVAPVPDYEELERDILDLESWVKKINLRRR